ncbi:hypothetical protein T492DRAFT_560351, partial [Pavlovales sp. CCMP2436]
YRERVRSLAYNISRNPPLQAAVCRRELGATELCALSPAELATEEERVSRKRVSREQLRRSTRNEWADAPRVNKHPCPRCSSCEDVRYEHVGGTRDIGKAETWGGGGGANDTDNTIRFACQVCGHDW